MRRRRSDTTPPSRAWDRPPVLPTPPYGSTPSVPTAVDSRRHHGDDPDGSSPPTAAEHLDRGARPRSRADGRLSLDDGAHHLRRLADREARLEAALADLQVASDVDPAVECARRLLHRALTVRNDT